MTIANEKSNVPAEELPSVAHTFRHVYRFILESMQGDAASAAALFYRYLDGELPEELLALSRRCVQADQRRRPNPRPPRQTPAAPRLFFPHRLPLPSIDFLFRRRELQFTQSLEGPPRTDAA